MKSVFLPAVVLTLLPPARSLAAGADSLPGNPDLVKGKPVLLFLCAGQSNMAGGGGDYRQAMPEAELPRKDIWFWPATPPDLDPGSWLALGEEITAGGRTLGTGLGPEASFAVAMAAAHPDKTVAVLKVSRGATPIGYWLPGEPSEFNSREGYLMLKKLLRTVRADLDGKVSAGVIPSYETGGFVWMQGEGNANGVVRPRGEYLAALKELAAFVNEELGARDIPIVLGRISSQLSPAVERESGMERLSKSRGGDFPDTAEFLNDGKKRGPLWHAEGLANVRADQEQFARDYPAAAWVDIDDIPLADPYHYTAAGYVEMGRRFAAAMNKLTRQTE